MCKNVQKCASQMFLDPIKKRALSRSVHLEAVYLEALLYTSFNYWKLYYETFEFNYIVWYRSLIKLKFPKCNLNAHKNQLQKTKFGKWWILFSIINHYENANHSWYVNSSYICICWEFYFKIWEFFHGFLHFR